MGYSHEPTSGRRTDPTPNGRSMHQPPAAINRALSASLALHQASYERIMSYLIERLGYGFMAYNADKIHALLDMLLLQEGQANEVNELPLRDLIALERFQEQSRRLSKLKQHLQTARTADSGVKLRTDRELWNEEAQEAEEKAMGQEEKAKLIKSILDAVRRGKNEGLSNEE